MKKSRIYSIYVKHVILFTLILLFISCGRLSQKTANEIFLSRNPSYAIVDSGPGEGNSDSVYYHFKFRKPKDEIIHSEIWLFVKQDDGTWKVMNREVSGP